VCGARPSLHGETTNWLDNGSLDWFWEFADQAAVPVSIFPQEHNLPLIDEIAARHPTLRLSIDHLATSTTEYGFKTLDRIDQLQPLAQRANIAVKASAVPLLFPDTYSVELVRALVDRVFSWFGSDRLVWGWDYTAHQPGGMVSRSQCSGRESHICRSLTNVGCSAKGCVRGSDGSISYGRQG
jgi:hypothetical protein